MTVVHTKDHKPRFSPEEPEVDESKEPVKADAAIIDILANTHEGRLHLESKGWKAP